MIIQNPVEVAYSWLGVSMPTQSRRHGTHEVVEACGRVAGAMIAFRNLLGENPAAPGLACLANMAPRLVELRRALKPTGSSYLHCDPTASHYLKMQWDWDDRRCLICSNFCGGK